MNLKEVRKIMDNMEKIIFNKVYQIQHIVRGRYNPEEFMNIIQECFFLKLLPNNLDEYKDIFNSEDLQYKIKKDTLLNGIIKHLFRIIDEDVFNSIRDIFEDEDFNFEMKDNKLAVTFNRNKVSSAEIIGQVMKEVKVVDFIIKETSIEDIVKKMYRNEV